MNKYEQRAAQERRVSLRNSVSMWSAGAALVAVVLLIVGLSSSAPSTFFIRGAAVVAILLLVLRQVARRMRSRTPRAAQPDPRSKLHLQ
jgi:hypothetical protein